MKKKQLHNLKKEELIKILEKRNYQYGELSNKYNNLKEELKDLQRAYDIVMQEINRLRGLLGFQ